MTRCGSSSCLARTRELVNSSAVDDGDGETTRQPGECGRRRYTLHGQPFVCLSLTLSPFSFPLRRRHHLSGSAGSIAVCVCVCLCPLSFLPPPLHHVVAGMRVHEREREREPASPLSIGSGRVSSVSLAAGAASPSRYRPARASQPASHSSLLWCCPLAPRRCAAVRYFFFPLLRRRRRPLTLPACWSVCLPGYPPLRPASPPPKATPRRRQHDDDVFGVSLPVPWFCVGSLASAEHKREREKKRGEERHWAV